MAARYSRGNSFPKPPWTTITEHCLPRWSWNEGGSRGNESRAALGPAVAGSAFVVVGYTGCLAARLIKGAVSREREFLADASAVQFTRNPESLVSVLKKIGGSLQGSKLETLHAEEASHFLFANGLTESFFELLSTHPSLEARIMRIDPRFDGTIELVATKAEAAESAQVYKTMSTTGLNAGTALFSLNPEDALAQFGTFKPEQLFYASNLLASIPEAIRSCVHELFGAREVIYCLLLDETVTTRTAQLELLKQHAERSLYEQVLSLIPRMGAVSPECRLPLIDMALPALRNLSPEQYRNFRDIITKLIDVDHRSSAFELALSNVLLRRLDPIFEPRPAKPYTISQMDKVLPSVIDLLSFLAHVSSSDPDKVKQSFQVGIAALTLENSVELSSDKAFTLEDLQQATEVLKNTAPFIKRPIVLACAACVSADGAVSVMEAELFRAIIEPLDCPISPFLPQYSANI